MILLVRHGETGPNRDGLLLGRADPTLTELGRRQADAVARALAPLAVSGVVSSPLGRARETAEAIAGECGLDVEVDERLVELDYGDWEGVPYADVPPDDSRRWRSDPTFAPPGGESLAALQRRVTSWCREAFDGRAADPGVLVAVSHVSPIKAATAWALGVDPAVAWRMWVAVASISRITRRGDGPPLLLSFNEVAHLDVLGAGGGEG